MPFEIPQAVREQLLADGWDGVSIIEPEGEQMSLGNVMPRPPERKPDADLDALFGPDSTV